MQILWFQDIKGKDEQEKYKKSVLGSKIVLDKAKVICYNKIRVGERSKLTDYDSPSWAYRQADLDAGRLDRGGRAKGLIGHG